MHMKNQSTKSINFCSQHFKEPQLRSAFKKKQDGMQGASWTVDESSDENEYTATLRVSDADFRITFYGYNPRIKSIRKQSGIEFSCPETSYNFRSDYPRSLCGEQVPCMVFSLRETPYSLVEHYTLNKVEQGHFKTHRFKELSSPPPHLPHTHPVQYNNTKQLAHFLHRCLRVCSRHTVKAITMKITETIQETLRLKHHKMYNALLHVCPIYLPVHQAICTHWSKWLLVQYDTSEPVWPSCKAFGW